MNSRWLARRDIRIRQRGDGRGEVTLIVFTTFGSAIKFSASRGIARASSAISSEVVMAKKKQKRAQSHAKSTVRASWRGMVRFGLVSFPAEAFNAHSLEKDHLALHQLHT